MKKLMIAASLLLVSSNLTAMRAGIELALNAMKRGTRSTHEQVCKPIFQNSAPSLAPEVLEPIIAQVCRPLVEQFHTKETRVFNSCIAQFIEEAHRSINGDLPIGPIQSLSKDESDIPGTIRAGSYQYADDVIYIKNGMLYSRTCFVLAHEMVHRFQRWHNHLCLHPSIIAIISSDPEKETDAESRAIMCIICHQCLEELYNVGHCDPEALDKGYMAASSIKKIYDSSDPGIQCLYHQKMVPLQQQLFYQVGDAIAKTLAAQRIPFDPSPRFLKMGYDLRSCIVIELIFHGNKYTISYPPFH